MQKSPYFQEKKSHMLPYLDNEFQLVARPRQDSKQFRFIWLIPLVDDRQSSLSKSGKIKPWSRIEEPKRKSKAAEERWRVDRPFPSSLATVWWPCKVPRSRLSMSGAPPVVVVSCFFFRLWLFLFLFVLGAQEVVWNPAGSSAKSSE